MFKVAEDIISAHVVDGNPWVPGAAMVKAAIQAVRKRQQNSKAAKSAVLHRVTFFNAYQPSGKERPYLSVDLNDEDGLFTFDIKSAAHDGDKSLSGGQIELSNKLCSAKKGFWRTAHSQKDAIQYSEDGIYQALAAIDVDYGHPLRIVKQFSVRGASAVGQVKLIASRNGGKAPDVCAFDGIMQCALLLWAAGGGSSTAVPFAFEKAVLPIKYPAEFTVSLEGTSAGDLGLTADIGVYDGKGRQIGWIEGLILKALNASEPVPSQGANEKAIVVSSFFTSQPLCDPLNAALAENGERANVSEAPYGQVFQDLLDAGGSSAQNTDVRLLLVRAEDFAPKQIHFEVPNIEDDAVVRNPAFPPPSYKELPNGMRVAQLNDYETDYLYHEIFECQAYRDDRVELPDDAVIIDIGANIGMFSLSMASDLNKAVIFAFEPSPQAYVALDENAKRFEGRVHAFNYGIGSKDETAAFTVYPNSSVFSSFAADKDEDQAAVRKLIENALSEKGLGDDADDWVDHLMQGRMDAQEIACQLRPLSAVIDEHDIQFIDLLKIDAEKSEIAVLDGLREEHWSRIRQLIIEVHDLTGAIADDIQTRLEKHGFQVSVRQETALEESGLFNLYAINPTVMAPKTGGTTALHKAKAGIAMLVDAAQQCCNAQGAQQVLVAICPPSPWAQKVLGARWTASIEDHLSRKITKAGSGVSVVRASDYLHVDPSDCVDPLTAELGDIPYKTQYFEALAGVLAKRIVAYDRAPYKVLVLDCDNTLWGGVCGEVTPDQLDLDGPYLAFRQRLKQLVQAGYLLCLCSKNEPQSVRDVFQARDDIVLEWDDFVAVEIGWGRKSLALQSLSERLDLNLADFVFVDDNPVECAEVHAHVPQVLVLQVPKVDNFAEDHFGDHWAMQAQPTTSEDASRTRFYQENVRRNDFQKSSLSLDGFLKGLKLVVSLDPLTSADLPRAAQLTARTNQFNIHKQALSAEAIEELISQEGSLAWLIRVSDRFGDYGITGLIVASPQKHTMHVSIFLLSCRVLGKGVEEQVLVQLAQVCASLGVSEICFDYVQSARNTPARNLLARLDPDAAPQDGVLVQYRCDLVRLAAPLPPADQNPNRAPVAPTSAVLRPTPVPDATPARQPDGLRTALQKLFAQTLGCPPSQIDPAASFDQLGVTSLQLIELTKGLDALLGRVKRTVLFEKQSINALVAHFAPEPEVYARAQPQHVAAPRLTATCPEPTPRRTHDAASPIAVVGMSGRFPMARNLRTFWENLLAAKACTGSTSQRAALGVNAGMDHVRAHYTDAAGLIEGLAEFDAKFFGIPPEDAALMSPQQRLFLQEAWNALEDGGYRWKRHADEVGVFVGSMSDDYALVGQEAVLSGGRMYADADIHEIANRVSYLFDFTGPSMALDTACSSSLTALHLACSSLRLGECNSALVGGVNLIAHPSRFTRHCDKELLSKRGVTASFADDADGFVDGEGVGCIMLRPLQDAQDEGAHIYGTILGSAINSRGRSGGFHAPGGQSHRAVIEKAYQLAGVPPASVSYIEAQGAGSVLGDGMELEALSDVHRTGDNSTGSCVIGSLKPNIGHLEAASGIAGLIKVLLQMSHGVITPMAASGRHIPAAALAEAPFVVQHRPLTWVPEGEKQNAPGIRRAAIGAFGATGSNAFAVLEERPASPPLASRDKAQPHLLDGLIVLSAASHDALLDRVRDLHQMICDPHTAQRSAPDFLARMAHSLQVGRRALSHRLALVVSGLDDLTGRLETVLGAQGTIVSGPKVYHAALRDLSDMPALNPLEIRSLQRFVRDGNAGAIASLWVNGGDIDWSTLGREGVLQKLPLPGYPFARDVFWVPDGGLPSPLANIAKTRAQHQSGTTTSDAAIEEVVAAYLHERLGVESKDLDPNKDLHQLGATSLFALRLVSFLNQEYALDISFRDIANDFSASGIVALVTRLRHPSDQSMAADPSSGLDADLIAQLERLAKAERNGS